MKLILISLSLKHSVRVCKCLMVEAISPTHPTQLIFYIAQEDFSKLINSNDGDKKGANYQKNLF